MTVAFDPAAHDPRAIDLNRRLEALVRAEIAAAGGLLPFDRFMELALYAPGLGYYVAGAPKLGPGGDFVTAPEVSPLFGACIAAQCGEVLTRLDGGDILELGPGSGALAVQVLTALKRLGHLPDRYLLLEPSPDLAVRQRERIATELPELAPRCHWLAGLPQGLRGMVIANEVLDAMPVHRFRIGPEGETLEAFVRDQDGDLADDWVPARSPGLAEAVARLNADGLATASGYSSEINLRAGPWLGSLAQSLESGLVLLIDYGYPESAYYQPDRSMGTLMCHLRHQAHADPYTHLGLQDITAHVDFSAVARAARAAGFSVAGFTTQAHLLIGCGIDGLMADAIGAGQPDPDHGPDLGLDLGRDLGPDLGLNLIQGAKQLLLPAAMGERFKVMGLTRGIEGPWRGFSNRDLADRL